MADSIDPYNLGEPVYRKSEVLTLDDLKAIQNGYAYMSQKYSDSEAIYQMVIAVGVCEHIIQYLESGKTKGKEMNP